jgi:hypothetical protein
MNRFEQLIEYVINDEEQKARELFHEIVVEKSREIYENLMTEEAEEDLDEAAEEDLDEAAEEELDEAAEEDVEESAMGGNAAEDLIDEVEMDEESDMNTMEDSEEEGEEDFEMGTADDEAADAADADMGDSEEAATKDDIMNLEDKLDELMAEFEQLMGDDADKHDDMGNGDDMAADEGGDAIAMDDTAEMEPMAEAISLKQVKPKVTTSEEGNGKSGPVAFNSGKAGMQGAPVTVTGGDSAEGKHDTAAYKNTTKDLISDVQNQPGKDMKAQKPATKPHLAQATGVNTKSPLPGGRRG